MTEGFESRVARYDMTQCNTGTGIDFVSFITVIFEMRADWLGVRTRGVVGGGGLPAGWDLRGDLHQGLARVLVKSFQIYTLGTNLGGCGAGGSVKCNLWEFGSKKRRKKIQCLSPEVTGFFFFFFSP